ncbi:phosphotyrosyl phosphatase activator [Tachypleus tridentatus]|uniref:phosphotyrosyl phosphatase activator n=1 Tax=Tachypleus tridentatus TaxID=6853 RepID=UPI003FD11E44
MASECNVHIEEEFCSPKVFVKPKKEITSFEFMQTWNQSEAYKEYIGFIIAMNEAVRGKKLTDKCFVSPVTSALIDVLNTLDGWIDEIPPIDQPQRFGNKAFRQWHQKLVDEAEILLKIAIPEHAYAAIIELGPYLIDSFGNPTRIDYGTGHEMAFAMFLCCLFKIGVMTKDDSEAVVNRIFDCYMKMVRKLQLTYRMEPAGSHGVWSLDDYQFIPFIWGSSQLVGHPRLEPKSFTNEETVEIYAKDYMFMSCIQFIYKVKSGPFAEHSNQLWNISGVPSWTKVNGGLLKMYKAEVLGKFPVVQHTLFGSILSFSKAKT